EDLDPGRDRDQHRDATEGSVGHRTHTDDEHVMSPDPEGQEADSTGRVDHEGVAEEWLPTEGRQDLGNYSEGWKHQDVDLGMPEDPEDVLPENRITTLGGVEEVRAELPVEGHLEQADGEGGHRQQQQDRGDEDHPD